MRKKKYFEKNDWFLIGELAWTDFKLRYNSSVFGYLWSLLVPLMIFGVLYMVFSVFIKFDQVKHYPLYLLIGIILWNYFAEATQAGMQSIQRKASLVTCINFPKWYIVLASNITSLLTLCLNLLVFACFFAFTSVRLTVESALIPFYLIQLVMLSFSLTLLLSSFYLRFRDLSHIWGIALQIGFWFTPVVYPVTIIPHYLRTLLMLNPLARLIQDFRSVLINHSIPGFGHSLGTLVVVLGFGCLGVFYFSRKSPYFAEEV
jgi:ABC-2 type transport system permease protein